MFAYSAICDVPEETLLIVTRWLRAYRHSIGTRTGRRAGQAQLVLVTRVPGWDVDRHRPGLLGRGGFPADDCPDEGIVNRPGFHAVFLLATSPDGEPVSSA